MSVRVEDDLVELRHSLAGTVIDQTDAGYDTARRGFNALIDRRPAVIVRCAGAPDIAVALHFAQAHELEVAVRGGGHNPAGHCVCDDGLVIDLSEMRHVVVDPEARIARSRGGATWLDFDTATQEFGLVAPGGIVGSTGVTGLALGGGIGHLTPQLGLTCDSIIGAELVIPDGTVVQATAGGERRAALGLARRWRQLRRGDEPRASAASTRAGCRRPARVSRQRSRRCASRIPRCRGRIAARPRAPGRSWASTRP